MAEALKSSCKGELIHNERRSAHAGFWRGRAEADGAAAAWIRWCHTARPHLALDGIAHDKQRTARDNKTRRKVARTTSRKTQSSARRWKRVRGLHGDGGLGGLLS